MYSDDEWEEFSPPEKGLNPGERVIWSRRAGMVGWLLFSGGCCLVMSPWLLLFVYVSFGAGFGNIVFAFVVIWLLLALFEFINSRRTHYYLTTKRIIEVRGGLIRTQFPLESFQGVDIGKYVEVKDAYTENGTPFYSVKLRDPSTGKVMRLTGLDEEGRDIILQLGR